MSSMRWHRTAMPAAFVRRGGQGDSKSPLTFSDLYKLTEYYVDLTVNAMRRNFFFVQFNRARS